MTKSHDETFFALIAHNFDETRDLDDNAPPSNVEKYNVLYVSMRIRDCVAFMLLNDERETIYDENSCDDHRLTFHFDRNDAMSIIAINDREHYIECYDDDEVASYDRLFAMIDDA